MPIAWSTRNDSVATGSRLSPQQPHVVDFLDVAMHDAEIEFRLEDFEVADGSAARRDDRA